MNQNQSTAELNSFASSPVMVTAANINPMNDSEDTIDLLDLFFMLRSHLLQILLAFVLGGVVFGAYSYYRIEPTYTAKAQMYMISSSTGSLTSSLLSELQLSNQLSADYSVLIKNRDVLNQVIDSLSLDMTYSQLYSMVSITNPNDTHLLYISVTSTDPAQSRDIANEIAKLSRSYLLTVMDTTPPNISQEAIVPAVKDGPNNAKNALIGAMLLAVVCAGFYTVVYLMDDTVANGEDLERYFNLRPLATIPEVVWNEDAHSKKSKKKLKG